MPINGNRPQIDLAIVGAGFAGMYMLHRALKLGLTARVIEAGSDVGGTWYWNRYPGARCDVESMQYSYQFDDDLQQEWVWSERYSPQPEILTYARHVSERYGLRHHIKFNSRVKSARYDEAAAHWTVETDDGEQLDARYCVMATGCLSVPNTPTIDGLDDFKGETYHTARWPHHEVDLKGKRIGVIGTGSTAIQVIPAVAELASRLYVFQRTANYAIPSHNKPLEAEEIAKVKANYTELRERAKRTRMGIDGEVNPGSAMDVSAKERADAYEKYWREGGLSFMGAFGDLMLRKDSNDTAAEFVRSKIRALVKDPEVAETLCPDNVIGAKRLCMETNYYATYNRDNVTLVNARKNPIERITPSAVRAGGKDYEIDVLILATGFDAMTGALLAVDIEGRNGAKLRDRWAHGPSSYLGLAMADFPNLFTVTGPGSPSVFTNMLPTIEQHVDWIADCLAVMQARNYKTVEAEPEAEKKWWNHVQEVAAGSLKASADSWYLGANVKGKPRVFMPYYGGFPEYCDICDKIAADDYRGFAFG